MKRVWSQSMQRFVFFRHRDDMRMRASAHGTFHFPRGIRGWDGAALTTTLPVDSTGNATVQCPMDLNNSLGICGPAQCDHVDRIWYWRQGKGVQLNTDVNALKAQYLKYSGGDNGTDESMLVGPQGMWTAAGGGLANDPTKIVVASCDIDITNVPLAQFAIDNFYAVPMAWSVPDAFIQSFAHAAVYMQAMTPDPANGHYTPLSDVLTSASPVLSGILGVIDGAYILWTWGDFCIVSPQFVASVQPQCFVAFSPQQFDRTTGLDSKGRHIVTQAAVWLACTNQPIPASVISAFPPLNGPTPVGPPPVGPSVITKDLPTVTACITGAFAKMSHRPVLQVAQQEVVAAVNTLYGS
jgi:hypothetical protein